MATDMSEWVEAVREAGSAPIIAAATFPEPPRFMSGAEITMHRALVRPHSNRGYWVVWTARGPMSLRRFRGEGWVISPLKDVAAFHRDRGASAAIAAWLEKKRLTGFSAETRREALSVLRAALASEDRA